MNVDYKTIDLICNGIALRLNSNFEDIDLIIGISRGGLLPATILSYNLKAKLLVFGIKSYNNTVHGTSNITQQIDFSSVNKNSKILVVDDICDTGETFKEFNGILNANGFKSIKFASMFVRQSTSHLVDYYGMIIDNITWVKFPWE